jgi:acyl dehydratase
MRTDTLDFRSIRVGDAVTPLRIDVTATVVVAGAIATRDFMPVHHDRDYAAAQGSPNIFMNILSDTGFCTRFLTDWAGPEAMVRKIAIRLGVPAYAGSKLEYTGSVTSLSELDGEGLVEVAFRAVNDQGDHVSGTAVIGLPLAGARA